jgi:hypothetical protein
VIRRFSSRRERLAERFLDARLRGARRYNRIAGYFSSGVLEVAGEALGGVTQKIRVVCNSEVDRRDVETARAAAAAALRRERCAWQPERLAQSGRDRLQRFYDLLRSGLLQVRVLPSACLGLIPDKAGVITSADGSRTAFLGSANESNQGWALHYELLWEDDSDDAVAWVPDEFDTLWGSPCTVPLADFVVEDIGRLTRRTLVPTVEDWRRRPQPAAPLWRHPSIGAITAYGPIRSTSSSEPWTRTRMGW